MHFKCFKSMIYAKYSESLLKRHLTNGSKDPRATGKLYATNNYYIRNL